MTARKLDIFEVLNNANNKNYEYFNELTVEQKKAFYPIVAMRWMSGTSDPRQLMLINGFINPVVFDLYKHPELVWKLMCIANSGVKRRYQYIKVKPASKRPTSVNILSEYHNYSPNKAADALKFYTQEDVIEMAEELSRDPADILKVKKEFKK